MVGRLKRSWYWLLELCGLRDPYDYAEPAFPDVQHEYSESPAQRCCEHCGGGKFNPIHRPPYDARRMSEIAKINERERCWRVQI